MIEATQERFPPLMRRETVAEYVRSVLKQPLTKTTLATMATRGGGPPFHKFGSVVLYDRDDVDRWARERLGQAVSSTSELRELQARAPELRRDRVHVLTREPARA
jgi:hypothetical protein